MNTIESISKLLKEKLGHDYRLEITQDNYDNPQLWLKLDNKDDILTVAECVRDLSGRCCVATAYQNKEKSGHNIVYHFDVDGLLFNVELFTGNQSVDSITPIISSANWAEREMKEMFGINPIGHPNPTRLFLDPSIDEGALNEYISLSKASTGITKSDVQWQEIKKEAENG